MTFWESFKTQYSQYCYASACFTSQYCYAMALLTSQLEHTRSWNYQFLQLSTFPLQWTSDAHHSSVYILSNLVSDVIAISLSTCYHHTFYLIWSEEEILRHSTVQHLALITEVVQHDIAMHERQPLCPRYISGSRHEFSAMLLKYMTTPVSVVDSGELFSLRTFHSAMKAALRPEATCSDINPQVSTTLILKKMYVLLCT